MEKSTAIAFHQDLFDKRSFIEPDDKDAILNFGLARDSENEAYKKHFVAKVMNLRLH